MAESSKNGNYRFDRFTLDTSRMMLYRDGEEILIPLKAVKTLAVFVQHQGSILSKDELISEIWEDSIVEESNLSQHLYLLRRTLGKLPDGRPYIETLRRRGYRFNGEARVLEPRIGRATPNSEPIPSVSKVERSGNVLRLVQQAPSEASRSGESPAENRTTGSNIRSSSLIAVILFAALTTVLVSLAWYKYRSPAVSAELKKEMTIERLTDGLRPADATLSPDGKYIVYHEVENETARMFLQQVGQPGRVEIARTDEKLFSAKTFSSDGKFIYVVAADKRGSSSALYRIPTVGGPLVKVLDNVYGPVSFSPDGKEMTYLRLGSGLQRSELLVANSDGTNERSLVARTAASQILGFPAWSPDGSLIAYSEADIRRSSLSGSVRIFGIDPFGRSVKSLSQEKWDTVYRMAWLNSGEGFVLVGTRENDGPTTRRDQIYFVAYPQGVSRRLTTDGNRYEIFSLGVGPDDSIIAAPFSRSSQIWSLPISEPDVAVQISRGTADGRAGLAPFGDNLVGYIARSGEDLTVWCMNADGTGSREVFNGPTVEELRADPQGRFFVFSAPKDEHGQLFRLSPDGTEIKQLTFADSNTVDSAVSSDGNWIVYASTEFEDVTGSTKLWKVPAEGGQPTLFSDEECSSPNFAPDATLISCIRGENQVSILSASNGALVRRYEVPPKSKTNFGAVFTPDGSALAYIVNETNASNIWAFPRNGADPYKLTSFSSGEIQRFAFSLDGKRLFLARGFPTNDLIQIRNFR